MRLTLDFLCEQQYIYLMKKLLIVLVLFAAGCSKDDPAPGVKYESLEGEWHFSKDNLSVDFSLVADGGSYKVESSAITINGVTYTKQVAGVFGPNNTMGFIENMLLDCDGCEDGADFSVQITSIEQVGSFSRMESSYTTYACASCGVSPRDIYNLTITRKVTD